MKKFILGIIILVGAVFMQSCEDLENDVTWKYRKLEGEWVMTKQTYYYYEHDRIVSEKVYNYSKWNIGKDRNQMRLIIERDDSEFYFTAYYADSYKWEYDSEYRVIVYPEGDMYRPYSTPTHQTEEYIGHIDNLTYSKLELSYAEADFEVVTRYEKISSYTY